MKHVVSGWRASGGEPDVGLELPTLLVREGFRVRDVKPLVFSVGPHDYKWRWPSSFVYSGLERLQQLGQIDAAFAGAVVAELEEAEADPRELVDHAPGARDHRRADLTLVRLAPPLGHRQLPPSCERLSTGPGRAPALT